MNKACLGILTGFAFLLPSSALAKTDYEKYIDDKFAQYGDGFTMDHDGFVTWRVNEGSSPLQAESDFAKADKDHDDSVSKQEYLSNWGMV